MKQDLVKALEALRQGEDDRIERALVLLQSTVFSFSLKLCGNRADAEDTMQETLFRVIPYLHRFDGPEPLAVWLYKTAKTRCMMSRRKSKYAPSAVVSVDADSAGRRPRVTLAAPMSESPENSVARREERQWLHRAALKLPSIYRVVLVLHDMEGLSTAMTAAVLGLNEGAVRVRLHRARMLLRRELEDPGTLRVENRPISERCRKLADQLSDYLDRQSADALMEELARHLAGCEQCRKLLGSLEQTVQRCRRFEFSPEDTQAAAEPRDLLLEEYRKVMKRIRQANRPTPPKTVEPTLN